MAERDSNSAKIKILVVDDHPTVREALAVRIAETRDLAICGEAADVAEALRLITETHPDIIITDITLKSSDGVDLIKRIKARDAAARILVWSMHSERLYAERVLQAGAMGYVVKDQPTEKIIEAMRQVLAGKLFLSSEMRERLISRVTGDSDGQDRSPVDALTDRELQVFRLIGQGVKTQEIADRLHLSVKTVETHRDRIKKKLELKDATDLIRTATLWVAKNP